MHESSLLRMEWFIKTYLEPERRYHVLDVGSYGVNGTYRHLFPQNRFQYVGLDISPGPNVDIVPNNIYNWNEIQDDQFDIVISGQAFEHIEFFWLTIQEMVRVLNKGGLICIIAPNGFGEHRYPVDCWRFFSDGMIALARYTSLTVIHAHTNAAPSPKHHRWFSKYYADSMLIALKPYQGKTRLVDTSNYKCIPADKADIESGMISANEYYSLKTTKTFELAKRFSRITKYMPNYLRLLAKNIFGI